MFLQHFNKLRITQILLSTSILFSWSFRTANIITLLIIQNVYKAGSIEKFPVLDWATYPIQVYVGYLIAYSGKFMGVN